MNQLCKFTKRIYLTLFFVAALMILVGIISSLKRSKNSSKRCGGFVPVKGDYKPPVPSQVTVTNYNTTWCGYSNMFRPNWEEVSRTFGDSSVKFVDMKCDKGDAEAKECQAVGILGFPTVLLTKPNGTFVEYQGNRTPEDLKDWIRRNQQT